MKWFSTDLVLLASAFGSVSLAFSSQGPEWNRSKSDVQRTQKFESIRSHTKKVRWKATLAVDCGYMKGYDKVVSQCDSVSLQKRPIPTLSFRQLIKRGIIEWEYI